MTDRERDLAVMKSFIGKTNGDIKNIWLEFNDSWDGACCSETACCISYVAGTLGKIRTSNYAAGLVNNFRRLGMFGDGAANGVFIFFDYGNGPEHTGRVLSVDGDYIYTVEGNINGKVVQRKYHKNDKTIYGYGYPYYEDIDMKFGVDVSRHNSNFDFGHARDYHGVEFAIIKGGGSDDGLYVDSRFNRNYEAAKRAGMLVGSFWYSIATTVAEARAEAEYFYENCLAGRQMELPVYIDIEDKRNINIGKSKLTDVIRTFCDTLKSKGWLCGVYSTANILTSRTYSSALRDLPQWIAYWGQSYSYDKNIGGIWQFGGETNYQRSTKINGQITDQDYMFVDYPLIIKMNGYNGYEKQSRFKDVSDKDSFAKAVYWAEDNGYVKGYSGGYFRPHNPCTRSQFVTILWRIAGRPSSKATVKFKDVNSSLSGYKAIQWAVEKGIIFGNKDGTFRPSDPLTRSQCVVMIWRWQGRPEPSSQYAFEDVNSSMSAYKAIAWAHSKRIAKGYSDGTFRPTNKCLRRHVVTFLYRMLGK